MLGMTMAVRSMATRVMLMQGRCFVMVFVLLRYACVSDTERQTLTHRHTQTHTDTHRHTDTHTCVCGICFGSLASWNSNDVLLDDDDDDDESGVFGSNFDPVLANHLGLFS